MTNMSGEFKIFVNEKASTQILREAQHLEENIPGASIAALPNPGNLEHLRWAAILGGDGTIRLGLQELYERGINVPIGVFGRGTNDVLFKALRSRKSQISYQDLRGLQRNDIPNFYLLNPGIFGNSVFINQVGFGQFEQNNGYLNDLLRTLPAEARKILVFGLSLVQTLLHPNTESPFLDIYSIGPKIGSFRPFPYQDFYTQTLTHVHSLGETYPQRANALVKTLEAWWEYKAPSPDFLDTEIKRSFDVEYLQSKIWIDGDTIDNPHIGRVEIRRTDEAYPIVALHRALF